MVASKGHISHGRYGAMGFPDDGRAHMVAEMFAHLGHIGHKGNPELAQMLRRAKAGEHHELRRLDGAAGEDHGAAGVNGSARGFSADGLAILDENFCGLGFRPDLQMFRQFGQGMQIGDGGGLPQAAFGIQGKVTHALRQSASGNRFS